MLNRKFIFILSLFICFLLSLPAVSATDYNNQIINSNDFMDVADITDLSDFNDDTNEIEEYHFNLNVTVEGIVKEKTYISSNYSSATKFIGIKNKELLLNFTVYDENYQPVKNGTKVAVYVFSKEYNSTIINGKSTIPVTINSTGDFAFEIRYYGNEYYKNSRNFTYISIYDEEFESEINNEIVPNDELNYNNSTNNSISSNSTNNTNSNINQSEDYDIITFDNYSYQGTKKNLSFKIPKIVGKVNQSLEIPIQASFDDKSIPNLILTINFNNKKEIVSIINGSGKLNLVLPNIKGNYNLFVSFNSTNQNNSTNNSSNSSEIESEIAKDSYSDNKNSYDDNKNNKNINYFNENYSNKNKNINNNINNKISMSKTSNPIFLLILSSLFLVIYRKKQ